MDSVDFLKIQYTSCTVGIRSKTWLDHACKLQAPPALLRRPGDDGARPLVDALAQLMQLKELKVDLRQNNIGAGPQASRALRAAPPRRRAPRGAPAAPRGRARGEADSIWPLSSSGRPSVPRCQAV